jgi:molybdopterin adenylyltransferase
LYHIGIAVISDSSYNKTRISTTEKLILELLHNFVKTSIIEIIPDDISMIKELLIRWSDHEACDLIVTTGGTGLSPRDYTPEATKCIIQREIPGIPEYIRLQTSSITPLASLSRSVCGTRNHSLIINLPGSEKAVREWLTCLIPLLPHALELIKGNVDRCGG